jgi:tetraacyldisaccharide 4'-kinase
MLSALAWIYGEIAGIRNYLYDRGVLDTFDLGAHTISVGNITAGGTGKTPLVAHIAEVLADRGEKVCILTRGYGRKDPKKRVLVSDGRSILTDAADAGDEPFELARKLLGKAIVIADADRVSAAEWAKRKFGVTAFVLDDGFQHRRARRGVDLVCIDATTPSADKAGSLRSGRMLPAGRLREPVESLRRANVIVITRADLADDISGLRSEISDLNPDAAVFAAESEIDNIVALREFHTNVPGESRADDVKAARCFAFCGIGNPEAFFETLRLDGIVPAATRAFTDHHSYSQKDIDVLERLAKDTRAEMLLTTAKDAVKLPGLKFELPCFVVEMRMKIDDEAAFTSLL